MRKLAFLALALAFVSSTAIAQNNNQTSDQEGSGNVISVAQVGNDNDSDITQSGDSNLSQVGQTGELTESTITQTGVGNQSYVTQAATANSPDPDYTTKSDINQMGTGNVAVVDQAHAPFHPFGAYSSIEQDGTSNYANVYMREYDVQNSSVVQSGTGNVAWVQHQRNTSNSILDQQGTGNYSSQFISAAGSPASEVRVFQIGTSNGAYQTLGDGDVAAYGNVLQTNQDGESNVSVQNLRPGGHLVADYNNQAYATQTGSFNWVFQYIGDNGDPVTGNLTEVTQSGISNTANVLQLSSDNVSNVLQTGSSNTATVCQVGNGQACP
jgi:hypothetical protein